MRILLLSGYDAVSHRHWRETLMQGIPQHDWEILSLPPRHFAWRARGNSLSWSFDNTEVLHQSYDLIIATSMVDLASLRGLTPALCKIPTLLYFHENQFAYPQPEGKQTKGDLLITSLYSALCADQVAFNTAFNRDSFAKGCQAFLRKLPDYVPKGLVDNVLAKSIILPVPIRDASFRPAKPTAGPLQIVWNHRWEYDKNPELLRDGMISLAEQSEDFHLHVVGQQFRNLPSAFDELKAAITKNIKTWGYIADKNEYLTLLEQADVVLSTALHDFQGLSILEGVAAGCIPVLPNRQAYPELFDDRFMYDKDNEVNCLQRRLLELIKLKQEGHLPKAPNVEKFSWSKLKDQYSILLEELARKDYV